MNRADFQTLAKLRIKEAKALRDNGFSSGAYYIAGYAVECAIKSCIAKKTNRHDFPPKRKFVERVYSHNLEDLMRIAGLLEEIESDAPSNRDLKENWNRVRDWSEEVRYETRSAEDAKALINAVVDKTCGVLTWLKKRW